jgi:predicted DCC family thiol-disulfide oxidoreductase YuxK
MPSSASPRFSRRLRPKESPLRSGRLTGETLVLSYQGRCQTRSEALLTILGRLPPPWPLLVVLRVVPRGLRDRGYDFVARNRAKWFGRPKVCMTSLAEYRDRFLE